MLPVPRDLGARGQRAGVHQLRNGRDAGQEEAHRPFTSSPYRKNDNAHVEQKNGSVVREYFADIRFDSIGQLDALAKVCVDISFYTNLFRP